MYIFREAAKKEIRKYINMTYTRTFLIFVSISSLVFIFSNLIATTESKKYMRCELSRELVEKYKISKTFLSNWICLIEHESDRDTTKKTTLTNGYNKYGLFQISSKECSVSNKILPCDTRNYPCCQMKCEDFLDDDIGDDVQCAKRIFELKGFQNWNAWSSYCRNSQNLPNLNIACNINKITPLSRFISYMSSGSRQ